MILMKNSRVALFYNKNIEHIENRVNSFIPSKGIEAHEFEIKSFLGCSDIVHMATVIYDKME